MLVSILGGLAIGVFILRCLNFLVCFVRFCGGFFVWMLLAVRRINFFGHLYCFFFYASECFCLSSRGLVV